MPPMGVIGPNNDGGKNVKRSLIDKKYKLPEKQHIPANKSQKGLDIDFLSNPA